MKKEYWIQIYISETEKWVTIDTFSDGELDKAYHNLEFYTSYPCNKYRLLTVRYSVTVEIN